MKPKRRERSNIMPVGVYDMRVAEPTVLKIASGPQKSAFSDGSDQQNAGDGNTQGSPRAIHMALRIFISGI